MQTVYHYENGTQWLVSHCEVIIPLTQLTGMTAEAIGQRVLALVPHLNRIAERIEDCPWPPPETLELLEALFVELDNKRSQRDTHRNRSKILRKDLRKSYEETFIKSGEEMDLSVVLVTIAPKTSVSIMLLR